MKRPNGIREWITFIFMTAAFLASICIAYEALNQRVGVVEIKTEKTLVKVEFHDTAIVRMETKLDNIVEDTRDIKLDIKDIRNALGP